MERASPAPQRCGLLEDSVGPLEQPGLCASTWFGGAKLSFGPAQPLPFSPPNGEHSWGSQDRRGRPSGLGAKPHPALPSFLPFNEVLVNSELPFWHFSYKWSNVRGFPYSQVGGGLWPPHWAGLESSYEAV